MQSDDERNTTAPRAATPNPPASARRGLRLQVAVVLTLLCVIMAGAWITALSG